MPKPGEWLRLEIPAKAIGVAGKTIRELAFCTFGGGVRWDWLGVAAARNDPFNYLEKLPEIKLAQTNDGWNGRVPVEAPAIFHVELRDTGGRTNANPDYYAVRAIPDMPPTARLMTPGRDIVVSTPTPVDLMASVADDVGLAKAELLLVRTRERKEIAKTIWSASWDEAPRANPRQSGARGARCETGRRDQIPRSRSRPQGSDGLKRRVQNHDRSQRKECTRQVA